METTTASETQVKIEKTITSIDNNQEKSSPQAVVTGEAVEEGAASPPPMAGQPHQWAPMQYPAAMMMQHQMMPPPLPHYSPHYMPYHPHYHQQFLHHPQMPQLGGGSSGENRTIWVGDLHSWMDEDYLRNCFATTGELASIKVIRNKQTGYSEGYGFVEFMSHSGAEKVLQTYSRSIMPHTDQPFRLNWATFSMGEKRSNNVSDLSIFVGDLAPDVTDALLHETFVEKYPSVKGAKVVIDANTGRSKGYGFVRFGDDSERVKAMTEMNGVFCSTRAMRLAAATPRKSSGHNQWQFSSPGRYSSSPPIQDAESMNTTIFVGGLDPNASEEDLRQPFAQYGDIASVKIPVGRGCGFVQYVNRSDAEEALDKLNGIVIGKQTVRLSWGRNPGNKQFRDFGNPWYYGGGDEFYGYGGYAFPPPPPPHNAGMYGGAPVAAYGGYPPMYGTRHQQQQQVN